MASPRTAPARRRTRTPDGEARSAILAATERLLGEHSLHDVSVTDIVTEAGVSRASFYFYFASKPAVLASLAQGACDEMMQSWHAWFEGDGPVDEATIRTKLMGSVRAWREHRATLIASVENWRHDPEVGAMWAGLMDEFIDIVAARLERDDKLNLKDPRAVAAALCWGTERAFYVSRSGVSADLQADDSILDALAQIWSRTLSG